jgi:hypothetical protein
VSGADGLKEATSFALPDATAHSINTATYYTGHEQPTKPLAKYGLGDQKISFIVTKMTLSTKKQQEQQKKEIGEQTNSLFYSKGISKFYNLHISKK